MKITSYKREDTPKRRQIDPKTLTKRSQIVRDSGYYSPVVRHGMTQTTTGFIKPGFSDAKFEVHHEIMNSGTCSAKVKHPTKTRTLQIISGPGVVIIEDESETKELKVNAGDSVVLEPNKAYKITTVGRSPLEFVSIQHAKYEARLETLEEAFVTASSEITPLESQVPTTPRRRLGKSKAVEQAAQLSSAKKNHKTTGEKKAVAEVMTAAAEGVNPRPSMGRFSNEGAG